MATGPRLFSPAAACSVFRFLSLPPVPHKLFFHRLLLGCVQAHSSSPTRANSPSPTNTSSRPVSFEVSALEDSAVKRHFAVYTQVLATLREHDQADGRHPHQAMILVTYTAQADTVTSTYNAYRQEVNSCAERTPVLQREVFSMNFAVEP